MSPFLIYGLADPRTDAVRYIGKSSSGLKRPRRHSLPGCLRADQTYKGNWIRSLLAAGLQPKTVVLEECAADALCDAECFWIAQARGLGWSLTNLTKGGDGTPGRVPSREQVEATAIKNRGRKRTAAQRRALSEAHKGIVIPPDQRAQMAASIRKWWADPENKARRSVAHAAAVRSPEFRAKISAANKGKAIPPEVRAKIAAAHRGMRHSEETRAKLRAAWVRRKLRAL